MTQYYKDLYSDEDYAKGGMIVAQKTFDINASKTNISARAYEIALKQLV